MAMLSSHVLYLFTWLRCLSWIGLIIVTLNIEIVITHGCSDGWLEFNEHCYSFSITKSGFIDAEKTCRKTSPASELVYINSEDEQQFLFENLAGRFHSEGNKGIEIWIGFSQFNDPFYWRWFNQNRPVNYVNWEEHQPFHGDIHEYCAVMISITGQWRPAPCMEKKYFICKTSPNSSPELSPMTTTPSSRVSTPTTKPPEKDGNTDSFACQNKNWLHFESQCYFVGQENKPWNEANNECLNMNATLVTLHSMFETHTLILTVKNPRVKGMKDTVWIGMYANSTSKTGRMFLWANEEEVTFTDWDHMEPNNFMGKEHCVSVSFDTKQWKDGDCRTAHPFVCVQDEDLIETTDDIPAPLYVDKTRCPKGYPGYLDRDSCYYLLDSSEPVDHSRAEQNCQSYSNESHLLYIMDGAEQDVIHYLLGYFNIHNESVWMGFKGSFASNYKWTSGHKVDYFEVHKNWELSNDEGCGVLLTNHYLYSAWSMVDCTQRLKRFICKAPASAIPTTPATTDEYPVCEDDWTYLGGDSCFKIFNENQSWLQAQEHCDTNHLVTIESPVQNELITKHLVKGQLANYWIGKSGMYEMLFTVHGDVPLYAAWKEGEPNTRKYDLYAVKMDRDTGKWFTADDSDQTGFICEGKIKGWSKISSTAAPSTKATAVVTTPSPSQCQQGFHLSKENNGKRICYKIHEQSLSWKDAREVCLKDGSELLSIHSNDLFSNLQLEQSMEQSYTEFWIGLADSGFNENYQWSDGSPQEYFNWAENEPKRNWESRFCGSISMKTGEWNSDECKVIKPFLCYKEADISSVKPTSANVKKGSCPDGFHATASTTNENGFCYKLFSKSEHKPLTWMEARTHCDNIDSSRNTRLAVVFSRQEQVHLSAELIKHNVSTAWIGLNSTINSHSVTFQWTNDGSVKYTNWDVAQPHSMLDNDQRCVRMLGYAQSTPTIGRWENANCFNSDNFICMSDKVESDVIPTKKPQPSGHCEQDGYVPLTPTWCVSDTPIPSIDYTQTPNKCSPNHILTIRSAEEQGLFEKFLDQLPPSSILSNSSWIDVTDSEKYTNWESSAFQVSHESKDCAVIQMNGKWRRTSCSNSASGFCEIRKTPPTSSTAPSPNVHRCQNSSWIEENSECYLIDYLHEKMTFSQAFSKCQSLDAHLVSIHSENEMSSIVRLIDHISHQSKKLSIWTGLVKNFKDGYSWSDHSPMNYFPWGNVKKESGHCVAIDTSNPKKGWVSVTCGQEMGFLCRSKATVVSGESTRQTPSSQSSKISRFDVTLFAVLVGVFILVGVLLFVHLNRKRKRNYRGTMLIGKGIGNVYFSPDMDEIVVHEFNTHDFSNVDDDLDKPAIQ